ncbi:hypothetical protein [Variovorax paradoxus]|uniref:hypothetical protein n=1 Tax=Variovorax paradoxus TaxID=34073 RepID=UPI003D65DB50
MERFFVSKKLVNLTDVNFETPQTVGVVAVRPVAGEYEVDSTLFDFSTIRTDILHAPRARNVVLRRLFRQQRVNDFISDVLQPGRHCREVTQAEYEIFRDRLSEKSRYIWKKKRRKQVLKEVNKWP